MSKTLFSVPIPALGPHPGGSITVTEPQPSVYLLTFVSPPDNRLTTAVCKALLAALDLLEFGGHPPGVLITTSGIGKFYSNGLDLQHAIETEGFWALFYSVWQRLLTFPMPTLALLNGHTYAGGLMLAMAHDYRLAPAPKGFLCLNEVLFGAALQPPMASLFRAKLPSNAAFRKVALEGYRFTGQEAVDIGIADAIAPGGLDDALKFVAEKNLLEKPKAGVYGTIKSEIYKDLIRELGGAGLEVEDNRFKENQQKEAERKEFGKVWVEQWRKENKSKL
ncbi:enoyl- hydratase isomerase [Trichoderma arundinaceum]|uniref:Enoyl-hydratase isomerase n=1 Tax=Trichoderma arundinaceum TaxID=490622 RepID=A0A395NWN3_TRIAR|nr:enoyl- hydratase isomerase [Trichoderma arundinaceum]